MKQAIDRILLNSTCIK